MNHDLDRARRKLKTTDLVGGVLYKNINAKGVEFRVGPETLSFNGDYEIVVRLSYDDLKVLFDEVATHAERLSTRAEQDATSPGRDPAFWADIPG